MNKFQIVTVGSAWVNIHDVLGVTSATKISIHNTGNSPIYARLQDTPPIPTDVGILLDNNVTDVEPLIVVPPDSGTLWVRNYSPTSTSYIIAQAGVVVNSNDNGLPNGLFEGLRAITIQDYNEANKKNGSQFAASRRIPSASENTHYLSILKNGDKPIDLKRREFAFSGEGIIADIFENPVYTGGTIEPVYSANGIVTSSFDFELLADFIITDGVGSGDTFPANYGTKFAPSIYALGPKSNQGKGVASSLYGSNYILAPNTSYLLVFYSIDAASQDIAARIEGYNGFFDLPRPTIV